MKTFWKGSTHLKSHSNTSEKTIIQIWAQNLEKETLKFIYSEKATKFYEIFTLFLSYVVPVKSKVKISQNFVAFSEYMNFTTNRL